MPTSTDQFSGTGYSVLLGLGLDVALHPDWNLRVAVTGSQGLNKLVLENKAKTQKLDAGRLLLTQAGLSLAHSF